MMRPKSWFPSVFTKPKNLHSLEHLKYLHAVLCKHTTVTESNRSLLVESMRSISEILIWGDQNDGTVFDFFLEKNMLSFFLSYIQQRYGRYICVQILQTLNILFENISNETSLYYLLSNNHINSIIVHKFDFSDEEVMAYFISFLKTLSLKLNKHTIHFFYNEHTNDFALYTEAIKFFNHSESMVRIAVRTITLNVYKVGDRAMLRYIRDKTAAPYFFNLVWFVGVHVLDLDCCVRNDADHMSRDRLEDLVAEHLDHLHYVNDILSIAIDTLNDILTEHMLNRLFIPLYVYSLSKFNKAVVDKDERKHVTPDLALFLLSQVFLILSHSSLVRQLADIIFHGDVDRTQFDHTDSFPRARIRAFTAPKETLVSTLESVSRVPVSRANTPSPPTIISAAEAEGDDDNKLSSEQNITDEEKIGCQQKADLHLANRPFLSAIFSALDCTDNDYDTLFSLCLLYAMGNNQGINQGLMDTVSMPTDRSKSKENYNIVLVEKLINIITIACQPGCKIRLVTLELSIKLLKQLVYTTGCSYLQDRHLASVEHARETNTQLLRNFYKTDEIFLDMFEDEYHDMQTCPLNIEYLMMDASILLAPTRTPLTGIDFIKRLPCGDTERSRRAIRVFFLIRDLSLTLLSETETYLPLSKNDNPVKVDNVLDLNNSDLIACTVTTRESKRPERRFLVIDCQQLILVEPDTKRLGWGVVRFVGLLQDVVVSGDKDDSRSLHATIHKPSRSPHSHPYPFLSAKFIFDDHIRCMAAKQRLTKGRNKARNHKIQAVERLLDVYTTPVQYPSVGPGAGIPGRGHPVHSRTSPNRVQSIPVTRQPERRTGTPENTIPSTSRGIRDGTQPVQSASRTNQGSQSVQSASRPNQGSPNRDVVINSCHVTQDGPSGDVKLSKSDIVDGGTVYCDKSSVVSDTISNDNVSITDKSVKRNRDDNETETKNDVTDVVIEHKLTHAESNAALNKTVSTEKETENCPNSPLRQEIQMKEFSRNWHNSLAEKTIAHTSLVTVKLRSHSHSPKRRSHSPKERSHSPKQRSKSGGDNSTKKMTSTACQTKKSTIRDAPPKTLKPADMPSVSLLQQPDRLTSEAGLPKLIPPLGAEELKERGEALKSMKSQITELAQMVQRHYKYEEEGK